MRLNLLVLSFLLLLMLLSGALFTSGLSRDAGYVLVLWQGWQLQTGVGFFLLLLLCAAISIFALLLLFTLLSASLRRGKKYQAQQAQQQLLIQLQHAMVYQILHAPEQALDRLSLQHSQHPSGWLVLIRLYFATQIIQQGHLERYLADIPASQQVFAQLIQAEWLLQQRQPDQALSVLFTIYPTLPEHLPPYWQQAVQQAVLRLWGLYAVQQPWRMLQIEPFPTLSVPTQQAWLQALRQQCRGASPEQMVHLLAYYDRQSLAQRLEMAVEWLELLVLVSEADERAWLFVLAILQQQLCPDVLWLWLQLAVRSSRQPVAHQQSEQLLNSLNQRYPAQPNVKLVHACWLQAMQQPEAAQQLLSDWPNAELSDRFNLLQQLTNQPELYQRLAPVLHDFTLVESAL